MASTALANWEWQNEVLEVADPQIYRYDEEEQRKVLNAKPWAKDVHFFKQVKISAIALLKMVMHARSGGRIEIMGLMQGKVEMGVMWVFDAFALPVEGTETRVNAQNEAYEYMVQYASQSELVGRKEKIIGWYHSHPGYGCWLSGIDVSTQMTNQQFQEPWLAIVIDPIRTIAAGKVSLGAFRTYPQGFHPPDEQEEEFESVPLNKVEDFGVHCKQYYSLNVSYFKSERDNALLERLWNRYWINTLSTTPWLAKNAYNLDRMRDITTKTQDAHNEIVRFANFALLARPRSAEGMFDILGTAHTPHSSAAATPGDLAMRKLKKTARDTRKLTCESASQALIELCKKRIFYDWNKTMPATVPDTDAVIIDDEEQQQPMEDVILGDSAAADVNNAVKQQGYHALSRTGL